MCHNYLQITVFQILISRSPAVANISQFTLHVSANMFAFEIVWILEMFFDLCKEFVTFL